MGSLYKKDLLFGYLPKKTHSVHFLFRLLYTIHIHFSCMEQFSAMGVVQCLMSSLGFLEVVAAFPVFLCLYVQNVAFLRREIGPIKLLSY